MEREILFRGKAINRDSGYYRTTYKNGDWVYGLLTQPYNERYDLPAEMANTSGVSGIEVDYESIGQYTGLTDKNGVKIFEGDIVKGRVHFIGGYRIRSLQVVYDSTAASFVLKDEYDDFKNIPEVCEVVGNIYDNGYPF